MVRDRQEGSVAEQDCRSAQQRFADHNQYHTHVLRVADVAIKACDDQLARWAQGGRSASAPANEVDEAGHDHRQSRQERHEAGVKTPDRSRNAALRWRRPTRAVEGRVPYPGPRIVNRSVRIQSIHALLLPPNDHTQRPARAKEGAVSAANRQSRGMLAILRPSRSTKSRSP